MNDAIETVWVFGGLQQTSQEPEVDRNVRPVVFVSFERNTFPFEDCFRITTQFPHHLFIERRLTVTTQCEF